MGSFSGFAAQAAGAIGQAAPKGKGLDDKEGGHKRIEEYKPIAAMPSEYKKGGKVRKTGKAKVHKGERVLTKKQAKRYEKRGRK